MAKKKILVVDDEEDLLELVRYNLDKEGYEVKCVASGKDAINEAKKHPPDLVILDIMLPDVDGFEVCKALKRDVSTSAIPIVMLSAKGEDADIVTGLELGADDYVTKPFSPKILVARIRTVLRRRQKQDVADLTSIKIRDLFIDSKRHRVMVKEKIVELTATEFTLLRFLARQAGWVFTRSQLIDAVKGDNYAVTERSVDVQIVGLRKKLGKAGNDVETVHGVGYRFKE